MPEHARVVGLALSQAIPCYFSAAKLKHEWMKKGFQQLFRASKTHPRNRRAKPYASQMASQNPNPPISEITPGLFIGDVGSSWNANGLRQHQIKSILSVNDEPTAMWRRASFTSIITQDRRLKMFCLDSSHQDLLVHMRRACEFIETSLAHGGVLVHCVQGVSRSTTFVIAYLMRRDRRGLDEVLADVKLKRKVRPSENFMTQLGLWGQMEYEIWEDEEKKVPKAPYAKLLKEKGLTAVLPPSAAEIAFGF